MARGENGYITVTAGMPDLAQPRPAGLGRRLGRSEQRALALRLRDQGWSYRRISAELAVEYLLVRRWLDGETAPGTHLTPPAPWIATGRPPMPAPAPRAAAPALPSAPPPAEPAAAVERLAAETRVLGEKIERLADAQAAQSAELSRVETRLVETIEAQHRTLTEKIVEALRALVSKLPLP
jgi:hypothetical protein